MTFQAIAHKRITGRTRVLLTGSVVTAAGSHRVLVRDVSKHGAQVYAENTISAGEDVCFVRGTVFVAARVAWNKRGIAGLSFYRYLSDAELEHPASFDQAGCTKW